MAGTITPNTITYYVAKASPVFAFTVNDDNGRPVNLTGATFTAYLLSLVNGSITKMLGTFAITNATSGQATYQWTLIDVNIPGGWQMYLSVSLPGEPYQREFTPVSLIVLPTPEYLAGLYMQEVDLNINGAPPTSSNPVPVDVIDRIARVLGHVIIDSMPGITGTVAPQVGGTNVSTSNPLPTTSGQVGPIAPWSSNPGTTSAGAEVQFKFGAGGTSTVQRIWISNETGADVRYELDSTASANSIRIKDGNVVFIAQPCQVVHLYTAAQQNINQAGGVMVRGYN